MRNLSVLIIPWLFTLWTGVTAGEWAIPWAAHQSQFRSRLIINNLDPTPVEATLTVRRMEGAADPDSDHFHLTLPALGQEILDPGVIFPNLGEGPGFAVHIASASDRLAAALVLTGTGSVSGSSPAQINAAPIAKASDKLVFPYFSAQDNVFSALVLYHPEGGAKPALATLHAWQDGRVASSTSLSIPTGRPHAATVDTLFPNVSGDVMVSVESDTPLLGAAFIFNDQLEPSMSAAVAVTRLPKPEAVNATPAIRAVSVTTVTAQDPRLNDAIAFDPDGFLTVSDFDGGGAGDAGRLSVRRHFRVHPIANGRTITRVDPVSGEIRVKTLEVRTPMGQAYDSRGNLVVAGLFGPNFYKVTPSGEVTSLLSRSNGPVAVAVDSKDNVYLSLLAEPDGFIFQNQHILKITPAGEVSTVTQSSRLQFAIGLAFDEQDNLYVGNHYGGGILKINAEGDPQWLAKIPGPDDFTLGYMTYAHGRLFATAFGAHQIYMIDLEGTVTLLAGTGEPGLRDGDPLTAMFDQPNGIAVSPDGSALYISEGNNRVIRRIDLEITP